VMHSRHGHMALGLRQRREPLQRASLTLAIKNLPLQILDLRRGERR
jgi:hypothetical protein